MQRDLSEYDIAYPEPPLAQRRRDRRASASRAEREPVLAALGFAAVGRKGLLHLMAGSKESEAGPWPKAA